jgi:hypothetical protein
MIDPLSEQERERKLELKVAEIEKELSEIFRSLKAKGIEVYHIPLTEIYYTKQIDIELRQKEKGEG